MSAKTLYESVRGVPVELAPPGDIVSPIAIECMVCGRSIAVRDNPEPCDCGSVDWRFVY